MKTDEEIEKLMDEIIDSNPKIGKHINVYNNYDKFHDSDLMRAILYLFTEAYKEGWCAHEEKDNE